MKYIIASIFTFCLSISAQHAIAQVGNKPKVSLNHFAMYVFNLQNETAFYKDLIQLDTIPEPFHDGKHSWFKIGEHSQLHLISGAATTTVHDKNTHLCFSVPSVEAAVERLNKIGLTYENWAGQQQTITTRPDGVKQIYLKDPEGFWVEINDDKF